MSAICDVQEHIFKKDSDKGNGQGGQGTPAKASRDEGVKTRDTLLGRRGLGFKHVGRERGCLYRAMEERTKGFQKNHPFTVRSTVSSETIQRVGHLIGGT